MLRLALLSLPLLMSPALRAGSVEFVLYAVDARAADLFPPEVTASDDKLAAHLAALEKDGKAATPLSFGGELKWSSAIDLSDGEEVEYFTTFTATEEKLAPDGSKPRFIGYKTTYRLLRQPDGEARISLLFEWTPTFEKVPLPKGGEAAWIPRFRTLKADLSTLSRNGEPLLAATWRTDIPLDERDKGSLRQLYLIMLWNEAPAEQ